MTYLASSTPLVAMALALPWYVLRATASQQGMSPDGKEYMARSNGMPFAVRWLLPVLLRDKLWGWRIASGAGIVASAGLVAHIATLHGLSPERSLFAAALFCGLGGLFHIGAIAPVLVDQVAFAVMLSTVALEMHGMLWPALIACIIGATIKETVPLFAAAATLEPLLLVALVVPLLAYVIRRPKRVFNLERSWHFQRKRLFVWHFMVAPWGVCLAALWAPTAELAVSCLLGYALLLVASDTTRVYQWAALPMIVAAAGVIPEAWLLPAAVAHLASPFLGEVQ